jgi:hypothetical protein
MEWNEPAIDKLTKLFVDKYIDIKHSLNTDRKNTSAHWNRYLKNYGITLIADMRKKQSFPFKRDADHILAKLISVVNLENDKIAGSLLIRNPDRTGQLLVVSRDIAERILVFGMI